MTRRSDPATLVAVRATGALAFVLLTVVPLALLVAELAGSSASGVSASLARRMGLLLATVRFSALAALSAVLVGSLAAMWAWVRPGRTLLRAAVMLSGLAIPVIAHVAAFRAMTDLTRALGMVQPSAAVSAWLVQALTLVPVAAAIVYAALRGVDTGAIDAARVQGGDTAAVLRVALPLAAPSLAAGFGLAFALSLAEHAVPSSFALDVYAMELYAEYSATGSAAATMALAVPLLVVAVAAAAVCAPQVRALATRPARRVAFRVPVRRGATVVAGWAGAAVALGWPALVFAALLVESGGPAGVAAAVSGAGPELGVTLWVAVAAGAVAAAVSLAMVASSVPRSARTWQWALGLALLAVPGPVVGAGLVAAWGSSAFEALYDSPAVLVAAALARYLPIATLLVAAASARVGGDTADAAAVAVPPLAAFRHAVLPRLAPAAVLGGLAVAALAAGEISASLMVVPPGFGTVATRMYNLLHYGASPDVAGLALATAAAEVALVAAGVAIATRLSLRGRSS